MDGDYLQPGNQRSAIVRWLLYSLATSGLCLLMNQMPALTLLLAIAWGVLIILAGIFMKPWSLLIMGLINGLALFWQTGWAGVVYYAAFWGMAAYVMALLVSRGLNYYRVRTWGIAAAIVSISLFLLVMYLSQGSIGINEMETGLNQMFGENLKAYESAGLLDLYAQQGISKQQLITTFQGVAHGLARHLPAIYYLQGIVAVFFMLLIASNLSLRRKLERLIRRPYKMEMMPWPLAWVVITGLSFWLWGYGQKNSYYYLGSNILTVMVPLACYYGLAALTFKLGEMQTSPRRWVITILIIVSVVFLPSAIIFLALSGLFDSLLDFRKLRMGREEKK
ncbi:MAG TPA: DUF2232 domain-containing protein [Syntrophomonadaceae bacterium]|nr:DUF2232 domain-containing protein [Syntrophomonadaceae bacterium]